MKNRVSIPFPMRRDVARLQQNGRVGIRLNGVADIISVEVGDYHFYLPKPHDLATDSDIVSIHPPP